ncbi:hypothetical protein AGMMS50230_07770 [Spirochaetia bacterium]|nr:hypothetical protein AGMMS50230_07770 [Spirochaetia bacterium]
MNRKIALCLIYLAIIAPTVFSIDLVGTWWGPEKDGHGFYLSFTSENDYKFIYSGEGGGQNVLGTYKQNENEVVLTSVTINEWGDLPDYIKRKTIRCSILLTDSLFAQYKLKGDGLELWNTSLFPQNGERKTVDGFPVYVYRIGDRKVNENARIREGPGLRYKYYTFSFEDLPEVYSSFPKGYSVTVLGRSENMDTIEGREEYWYFCTFRKDMWETMYCWIWGGLIDF